MDSEAQEHNQFSVGATVSIDNKTLLEPLVGRKVEIHVKDGPILTARVISVGENESEVVVLKNA